MESSLVGVCVRACVRACVSFQSPTHACVCVFPFRVQYTRACVCVSFQSPTHACRHGLVKRTTKREARAPTGKGSLPSGKRPSVISTSWGKGQTLHVDVRRCLQKSCVAGVDVLPNSKWDFASLWIC